jgi:peptidoglycan/xylan/chitin deacetylase (PgdA/CDA1 family)
LQSFSKKIAIAGIGVFSVLIISVGALFFFSSSGIPVLNYHQINNEAHNALTLSDSEFEAQMAYLEKSGYTAISPDQLVDYLQHGAPLPDKPVLITFDDGYQDNYRVAYPIMQKHHMTGTIFLITDFVGHNGRYLTWRQVREMRDHGFDFQSHTLTHLVLTKLSDEELLSQLVKSREALEWRLGKKVSYMAYPGGIYDKRVVDFTKQAGYRAAFTINFGRNHKNCGLFTLNRIPIFEGQHTFFRFWLRLKFTHFCSALQQLRAELINRGASSVAGFIYNP